MTNKTHTWIEVTPENQLDNVYTEFLTWKVVALHEEILRQISLCNAGAALHEEILRQISYCRPAMQVCRPALLKEEPNTLMINQKKE